MVFEVDLDVEVKSWSMFGEYLELFEEFVEFGLVVNVIGLLVYENIDIVIGVIEIIFELLDEDVEVE